MIPRPKAKLEDPMHRLLVPFILILSSCAPSGAVSGATALPQADAVAPQPDVAAPQPDVASPTRLPQSEHKPGLQYNGAIAFSRKGQP